MFIRNLTLDRAIYQAMRDRGYGVVGAFDIVGKTMRLRRSTRKELEGRLTELAVAAKAIPPTAVREGVFDGSWLEDLLQFIIDNWEVILEIILTIINIFVAEEDQ